MYHTLISRKSTNYKEEIHNFRNYKDSILNITYNMLRDNSHKKYQHYYLYEKAFMIFSQEIVSIHDEINYEQPIVDICNTILEHDKSIIFSKKNNKSVLEYMKKKTNIIK
tara:strand:+ start:57 stop:386 length:330 start_codon:yes stop_codon:yes gene_type:complete